MKAIHTKGQAEAFLIEVSESNSNPEWIITGYDDKSICNLQLNGSITREEMDANANRIIKCWNMHDELLDAIKKAVNISDLWTFDKDVTIEHEDEAKALYNMKLEFDRVIKKATE